MSAEILLASSSPRRKQLLSLLGIPFTVWPADIDETLALGQPAELEPLRLSIAKAQAGEQLADYVIGADTIVILGERRILGKPQNPRQAAAMLKALRGKQHRVVTGVAVVHDEEVRASTRITRVRMRRYTDADIAEYVARGEPFDKAGGYAIQDATLQPVESLEDVVPDQNGCYCNVMGLPLRLLLTLLTQSGYPLPKITRPAQCANCPDWR